MLQRYNIYLIAASFFTIFHSPTQKLPLRKSIIIKSYISKVTFYIEFDVVFLYYSVVWLFHFL